MMERDPKNNTHGRVDRALVWSFDIVHMHMIHKIYWFDFDMYHTTMMIVYFECFVHFLFFIFVYTRLIHDDDDTGRKDTYKF